MLGLAQILSLQTRADRCIESVFEGTRVWQSLGIRKKVQTGRTSISLSLSFALSFSLSRGVRVCESLD